MKAFPPPFRYPAYYRVQITVEAEDLFSAWPHRLSMRHTRPTSGRASIRSIALTSALVVEGRDVDPWRFVPDGGDATVLPVPGVFSEVAACAGYAATRSEDLVNQLRIMIDAVGADGWLRITPAAMVRLCATVQAILDDIARCGLSPTGPKAATSVVMSAPDAT